MQGLSTDVVSHKLRSTKSSIQWSKKTRKFKPELSLKIKEEITKQIESRLVEVTQYPTWLANVVSVAKKDGKIRICVDYRDLNKASPKDNFPLPNIHILIDNCANMRCSHWWIVTQASTKFWWMKKTRKKWLSLHLGVYITTRWCLSASRTSYHLHEVHNDYFPCHDS